MNKIFVSCKFDANSEVSDFVTNCIKLGRQVDMDLYVINNPNAGDIKDKIREAINNSAGILFVLEDFKQKGTTSNFRDWMAIEAGMADAINLPMGIINNSSLSKPDIFANNFEELSKTRISDKNIMEYLKSLNKQITSTNDHEFIPTYDRDFIMHKVIIKPDGRAMYMTGAKINALRNGVQNFQHSIYTKYLQCWDSKNTDYIPEIYIMYDSNRFIDTNIDAKTTKKCTWDFTLDKPLKKNESISYFFCCEFPEFYPMKMENLKKITENPKYPLTKGIIEHTFYISKPTKRLEMELFFENANVSKDFKLKVFNGRTTSYVSLDKEETKRIKNCLHKKTFEGKKTVRIIVDNPKFDSTYSINWKLVD